MDKPKELVLIIEMTPRLATYPSERENMRYSSKHTDEELRSLLSGKTQQRARAVRANRQSKFLCVPFCLHLCLSFFLKAG